MPVSKVEPQISLLNEIEQRLAKLETEKSEPKSKDLWDKIGVFSGLMSGLIVAAIGFYATYVYDERSKETEKEQKARSTIATELQTVEKFIPHLASKDEQTKEAAILAISSLGNTELAAKMAKLFGGAGARSALTAIASSSPSNSKAKEVAQNALEDIYRQWRGSLLKINTISDDLPERSIEATGFVISRAGYVLTVGYAFPGEFAGNRKIQLRPDNSSFPLSATLVKKDTEFALLKIDDAREYQPLPIRKTGETKMSDRINILGFSSAAQSLLLTAGTIVGSGPGGQIAVDALATPGMGGAPVFDSQGEVVAILKGGLLNTSIGYAIPIQHARPLLSIAGL